MKTKIICIFILCLCGLTAWADAGPTQDELEIDALCNWLKKQGQDEKQVENSSKNKSYKTYFGKVEKILKDSCNIDDKTINNLRAAKTAAKIKTILDSCQCEATGNPLPVDSFNGNIINESENEGMSNDDYNCDDDDFMSAPMIKMIFLLFVSLVCSLIVIAVYNNIHKNAHSRSMREMHELQSNNSQLHEKLIQIENRIQQLEKSTTQRFSTLTATVQAQSVAPSVHKQAEEHRRTITQTTMYFSPASTGVFANGSSVRDSNHVYELTTNDGRNGVFKIIDANDSIATALISVSEFVKPMCTVENNVANPVNIITVQPGTAINDGGVWRVTNKAIVRLI